MRRTGLVAGLILSLAIFFSSGCRKAPSADPPAVSPTESTGPLVVVVSWDGAKPSILKRLLEEGRLPTLKGLLDEGCYTFEAQTIHPSSTLPSHVSMLTGLEPAAHGVTWNSYKPERGYVPVPTVFEIATEAGMRTAMVCGKEKFWHLRKPGTLAASTYLTDPPGKAVEEALRMRAAIRPHLLFLHLRDPDIAGHDFGWGCDEEGVPPSEEYIATLEACDRALGIFLERLMEDGEWGRTLLIVTADHGGHGESHGTDHPEDMTIPWIASGGLVKRRGEIREAVGVIDTTPTVLDALGLPVPEECEGKVISYWEAVLEPAA